MLQTELDQVIEEESKDRQEVRVIWDFLVFIALMMKHFKRNHIVQHFCVHV